MKPFCSICSRAMGAVISFGVDDQEDLEKIKIGQLANVFSLILTVYVLVFSLVQLSRGKVFHGLLDLGAAFLILLNLVLFRRHRKVDLAVNILIFFYSLLFLYLQGYGGWAGLGFLWIVLYPLVILPLKGAGKGTAVSLLMLTVSGLMFLLRRELGLFLYERAYPSPDMLFQRMVYIFIAGYVVSFSYVRNRHRLYEEIQRLSLTDPLTRLPNRRNINSMLEHQSSLYLRHRFEEASGDRRERVIPFSCLLCDIDGFKDINDTHGHLNGDVVLCQFAELIRERLRGSDFVGRWGGEEFLIILEETDLVRAVHVAKKLLKTVRGHSFVLQNGQTIRFTMSCGVSCFTEEHSMEDFLRELDNNLYLVKRNGKDGAAAQGEVLR